MGNLVCNFNREVRKLVIYILSSKDTGSFDFLVFAKLTDLVHLPTFSYLLFILKWSEGECNCLDWYYCSSLYTFSLTSSSINLYQQKDEEKSWSKPR